MNEDIRTFLRKFTAEELVALNVLSPYRRYGYLLRGVNVNPLVELMKRHNVTRLEAPDRDWFLTSGYEFQNPWSEEHVTGDVRQLASLSNVFNEQNRYINPFFRPFPRDPDHEDGREPDESIARAEAMTFRVERDLQTALRANIEQLESRLKIVDGGKERSVDAGRMRIDITAEDKDGNLVVIELKAGPANSDSLTQILSYMAALEEEEQRRVRGILVAGDFHDRVVRAARKVPDLQLKQYSFSFAFHDPNTEPNPQGPATAGAAT